MIFNFFRGQMKVDMSAKAIDRRLRATSDLRELCLKLGKVGAADRSNAVRESSPRYESGKKSRRTDRNAEGRS